MMKGRGGAEGRMVWCGESVVDRECHGLPIEFQGFSTDLRCQTCIP